MMPLSFYENVYDLLISYGEVPRLRVLKLYARHKWAYSYTILHKDNFVKLCKKPSMYLPEEFTCNTIAFKCDRTGYCYVFEDTKRHPKKAPISEINKQIQSLREKYFKLPVFW